MKKRFLCLLMVCALCTCMLPAAVSAEQAEMPAVAAEAAVSASGAAQPVRRIYNAGDAAKDASSTEASAAVFRPYVFEIGSDNRISAKVEVPARQMSAGAVHAETSGDEVPAANTTVTRFTPQIRAAIVDTDGTATVTFYTENTGVLDYEIIAYTANSSLAMSSEAKIIDGSTCYMRAISTVPVNSTGVQTEGADTGFNVTLNDSLYYGSASAFQAGEKLFILIEEVFSQNPSAMSGPVQISVGGGSTVKEEPIPLNTNATVITLTPESFTYSGNPNKPAVMVQHNGTVLSEGEDYTVTYEDNTEVGKGLVVVTGIGKYSNEAYALFFISEAETNQNQTETKEPIPLNTNATTVTLSPEVFTYSGNPNKPAVTVMYNATVTLTEGTDFTVTYKDNTEAGQGIVVITGIGNYTETVTHTFLIQAAASDQNQTQSKEPIPLTSDTAVITLTPDTYTYSGKPNTPSVTVLYNGTVTLTEGTDYTVTYINNTDAGTGLVVVNGTGLYIGSVSAAFIIQEAPPEKPSANATYVIPLYVDMTGENTRILLEQNPEDPAHPLITVLFSGDYRLKEGRDYELEYILNKKGTEGKVIVRGKGDLKGEMIVDYLVNKVKNQIVEITSKKTVKLKKLQEKTQSFMIHLKLMDETAVSYKLLSVPEEARDWIKLSKAGKVTIKKGLPKGKYTLRIRIRSAETAKCFATEFIRTLKIIVK